MFHASYNYFPIAIEYGLLILILYILLLWGYRIVLHPLSRYPGPVLAKLTNAYAGYFAVSMTLPYLTWKDHVKYGPVLRHGPNRLIFNSASALQDIYQNDKARKSFVYELTTEATGTVNIFNAIEDDVHRRKRRLVGHAVTDRAMRSFEPLMNRQVDILLLQLRASQQKPIDATPFLRHFTMDVVSLLAFGYPLNTQTDERDRWLSSALVAGNAKLNSLMNFPITRYARMGWILPILTSIGRTQYETLIHRMVQSRLSQPKNAQPDLFSSLTSGNGLHVQEDKMMEPEEIWQEASFFISAGADTTSTAICALLFYISRHHDIYTKLAQEIRSTFKNKADITGGPKLAKCYYLRACIDEALRMSPPVGGTLWRQSAATKEPLIIDSQSVPLGTQVGVNIFSLHHNEDCFPEPFSYKPERWLPSETSEAQRKRMNTAFVPFSIGARSCAGKAMAYLETSLVIIKILHYFDFERAPGGLGELGVRKIQLPNSFRVVEDFDTYDVISASHNGPCLVFQPRHETIHELKLDE